MKFTEHDFNQTCLLSDDKPGIIIQIDWENKGIAVQVPGKRGIRYLHWDAFERRGTFIIQKATKPGEFTNPLNLDQIPDVCEESHEFDGIYARHIVTIDIPGPSLVDMQFMISVDYAPIILEAFNQDIIQLLWKEISYTGNIVDMQLSRPDFRVPFRKMEFGFKGIQK